MSRTTDHAGTVLTGAVLNYDESNVGDSSGNTLFGEGIVIGTPAARNVVLGKNAGAGLGVVTLNNDDDNLIAGYGADIISGGAVGDASVIIGSSATGSAGSVIIGRGAGSSTIASGNTVIGLFAGFTPGIGAYNVIVGHVANSYAAVNNSVSVGRSSITSGDRTVAVGYGARANGANTVAIGNSAVATGPASIAIGSTTASGTANSTVVGTNSGHLALPATNTGFGYGVLQVVSSTGNTAVGHNTLAIASTATQNTALGISAGSLTTTGDNCTMLGVLARCSAAVSNSVALGSSSLCTASNRVELGSSGISSLRCQVALTVVSDERAKEGIEDLEHGGEFLDQLRPVEFQLKKDENNYRRFGFIAQEVDAVLNQDGKSYYILQQPTDEEAMYTMSPGEFIAILVKSVKELRSEAAANAAVMGDLLARVDVLEA
jgi:hypothetical protein